ncbi:uncharacterized protein [Battus philenor]|uniref:uncharacterized protein n=1 Tax=Battus philenor TaxID=42288 RepID=UPI0035D0B499
MDEGETKICQNCKREIPAVNFTIHSVHCTRNLRVCPVCKEPVLLGELERHNEKLHKLLPCKQCGEKVSGSDMEDHIRDSCAQTIQSCRFCDLELSRQELPTHEGYCGTRTEQCPDCREWVMLRYRQLHLDSNHGFLRLDDDPVPGANNIPNRMQSGRTPPGLINVGNNNWQLRNGFQRNINLMFDPPATRSMMYAQMTMARLAAHTAAHGGGVASGAPPQLGQIAQHSLFNSFNNSQRPLPKRNNSEVQANLGTAARENKNTASSRGAVKKRAAPKPPSVSASAPTSPIAETSGIKNTNNTSTAGPSTSSSSAVETARASANDFKSKVAGEKLKKELKRGLDELNEFYGRPKNPEKNINNPQSFKPKENFDNYKNVIPMSPEEFMTRFKEIQIRKKREAEEASKAKGPLNKADRFNEIKSSLKELRRGLNEVTAPYNINANSNNNINANEPANVAQQKARDAMSDGSDEEDAAGGANGADAEGGAGVAAGVGGADDILNVRLPCEFCGVPVLADDLVLHQTGCQPDLAQLPPGRRQEPPLDNARAEPVIPCEFCTESLPVYLISEHQERCGREANLLFPD